MGMPAFFGCAYELVVLNKFMKLEKYYWEACFYRVLWSLWKSRNDLIFNNVSKEVEEISDLVKTS